MVFIEYCCILCIDLCFLIRVQNYKGVLPQLHWKVCNIVCQIHLYQIDLWTLSKYTYDFILKLKIRKVFSTDALKRLQYSFSYTINRFNFINYRVLTIIILLFRIKQLISRSKRFNEKCCSYMAKHYPSRNAWRVQLICTQS